MPLIIINKGNGTKEIYTSNKGMCNSVLNKTNANTKKSDFSNDLVQERKTLCILNGNKQQDATT